MPLIRCYATSSVLLILLIFLKNVKFCLLAQVFKLFCPVPHLSWFHFCSASNYLGSPSFALWIPFSQRDLKACLLLLASCVGWFVLRLCLGNKKKTQKIAKARQSVIRFVLLHSSYLYFLPPCYSVLLRHSRLTFSSTKLKNRGERLSTFITPPWFRRRMKSLP